MLCKQPLVCHSHMVLNINSGRGTYVWNVQGKFGWGTGSMGRPSDFTFHDPRLSPVRGSKMLC